MAGSPDAVFVRSAAARNSFSPSSVLTVTLCAMVSIMIVMTFHAMIPSMLMMAIYVVIPIMVAMTFYTTIPFIPVRVLA